MLTKALIPLLAVASFACFAVAATAQGPLPPVACPSAVAVAHDAAIGQLPVPQGTYQLTLMDPGALSCAAAADAPAGRPPAGAVVAECAHGHVLAARRVVSRQAGELTLGPRSSLRVLTPSFCIAR
jgi:hypothetical protein